MTFNEKQIRDGNFTVLDMQRLVLECNKKAFETGVKIGWSVRGLHTRASIKQKGKTIWQQRFTAESFPLNLCLMYERTHQKLSAMLNDQIEIDRKNQKESQEREQERRIAALPAWGEKIKNQG